MKHADAATLQRLSPLLEQLRTLSRQPQGTALVERKTGVFYVKAKAFLHFHDDPAGQFADVRLIGTEFERFPVSTAAQQRALVTKVTRYVTAAKP